MLVELLVGTVVGVPATLLAALLAYLGVAQVRNILHYRNSGCNIPSMPQRPFIGGFRLMEPHVAELDEWKTLGPVSYSTMFEEQIILVADPDLAQLVLAK